MKNPNSLTPITITAADGASFSFTPYGAHVTSWIPADGDEQLFLSKDAEFKEGAAIRGGVPVIFPQFHSLGSLPRHGFARTTEWDVLESGQRPDGTAYATLQLTENIARLAIWPFVFTAQLHISAVANKFKIALHVVNTGDTKFTFTNALHTYFAVKDALKAEVHGLHGVVYGDAGLGKIGVVDHDTVLHITGELDRVYENAPSVLELVQPHQRTTITSSGFTDAVIWNPGKYHADKMKDMEADGEKRMLCIEAGAIATPVSLQAGAQWLGSQMMEVVRV
jgi:glucose-6-phosphate 1-epimerase